MLGKKYLPDPSNLFLVELNTFKDFNSRNCISSGARRQLLCLTHKYHYREQRVCARLTPFSTASKVTVHPASARKRIGESPFGQNTKYTGHVHFLHPNHPSSMMSRRAKSAQVNKVVLKYYVEFHIRRLLWYFASNNLQRKNAISLYFKE